MLGSGTWVSGLPYSNLRGPGVQLTLELLGGYANSKWHLSNGVQKVVFLLLSPSNLIWQKHPLCQGW